MDQISENLASNIVDLINDKAELLEVLAVAKAALYNDIEPDNQSRAWYRVAEVIARLGEKK